MFLMSRPSAYKSTFNTNWKQNPQFFPVLLYYYCERELYRAIIFDIHCVGCVTPLPLAQRFVNTFFDSKNYLAV